MVKLFKKNKCIFYVLQCTTKYPTSLKEIGLNVAHEIKKKFKCAVVSQITQDHYFQHFLQFPMMNLK